LDAGTIDIRIREFPIGELLARLANDYIPLARKNGVTLKLVTTDAIVNSDPILLERMLINLIVNAIRYTPVGGRVLVGCRLRGDRLRIEVRDNGIGISAHDQTRIFREFIQLANPERDREKGLGLGLAIVDRIAKLLKHHVTLRSEINKGSTFAVYVPRMVGEKYVTKENVQVKEMISARQNSVGLENLNVLVVEDDALVRKSTQGILESWGCRVSLASCFNDIKQIHNDANFDLVICDYRLPDGDGIQIKKWIGEYFESRPMFILITGDISPDILRMVRESNIDLLHKPVRPAKLRSLIQFLLSQNTLG
jgi:CheY-like chemotaxis protein